MSFPGLGTVVNVATVLVGSGIGVLAGHRLPERTRSTVTDVLGLVTLLLGALAAAAVRSTSLAGEVGSNAPVLIVLGSFASIAFAASLGLGVMAAALAVLVVQGTLTLVGFLAGDLLPTAHVDAVTAVGGLLLVGVGLRLLALRAVPVGNLLPALLVAPLLVAGVGGLR